MKNYYFTIPIKGFESVGVEADSLEEAIKKMENGEISDSWTMETDWDIDETDFAKYLDDEGAII